MHDQPSGAGTSASRDLRVDRLWPDPATIRLDELREHYLATWPDAADGAVAMMISSLDGSAQLDGVSGGLSSSVDQALMDLDRSVADVVVVGAGTLREEGYGGLRVSEESVAWRRGQGLPDHPVLAVVSARLDLRADTPFLAQAPVRPLILTGTEAPAGKARELGEVAEIVVVGDGPGAEPAAAHQEFIRRGLRRVLCEGGPSVLSQWFDAGRVAELHLSVAGSLAGGAGQRIMHGRPGAARPAELLQVLRDGSMLMLRHRVG